MSSERRRRREGGTTGGLYCSHCGEGLEPSMNFCPSCGRPSGSVRSNSVSTGIDAGNASETNSSRPALERRIAVAMGDGWELEHDFGDHVVMVRRSFGGRDEHLVVAALSIWWTMGLGNALYGLYRYVGDAERMVLRTEPTIDDESASNTRRETATRIAAASCLTTALALAGLAIVFAGPTVAPILLALAVGLATVGLGLLPSIRRRLSHRRSVTTNGAARSVDERSIVDYDRPCAACAGPVGRGLERVYRKGFYVLGVPLTLSEGRNAYCRRCANAEASQTSAPLENDERSIRIHGTSSGEHDRDRERR